MLERSQGLSELALDAIVQLERRVVAVDGGRLKLEWGALRSRSDAAINDVLWWSDSQLLGFLGIYCFDGRNAELVGMVDPAARRRGIATALLDSALALCEERSYANVLLVVPRNSVAGRGLAVSRGSTLNHSEHALILNSPPSEVPAAYDLVLRNADRADTPTVSRLLAAAFGSAPDDVGERLVEESAQTLVVMKDGLAVGTLRVTRNGAAGGVYGFAIDPLLQGRGIGRQVLSEVCRQLFADGVDHVGLEVATDNEHALGLYTSIGFAPVTIEDYFSLAT